ncbi:MAG TPA: class I lanthipeptide [Thermoanaerobaculia bacterium]|nr:class I lanthipeptide [Thermoanaerobaculia bacterium]
MKKHEVKKLSLSRETLVRLSNPDLGKIAGAAWSENSVCPTTEPSECKPCV